MTQTNKEELENDKNNNNDKPPVEKTRYYKLYKWSEWQTGTSDKAGDENKKVLIILAWLKSSQIKNKIKIIKAWVK